LKAPPIKHVDGKKLRAAALAYPQTVEDFPWGDRAMKVAGKKVFLFIGANDEGGFSCSMKLPYRHEVALKVKGARPTSYGLGRSGWVSFTFTAKSKVPMAKILDWLDESWRAVAPAKLSATHPAPAVPKRRKAS
jgi:predicted DNA-binding protein (MmcQ/YjbR family)